jgi:hypothetical protein
MTSMESAIDAVDRAIAAATHPVSVGTRVEPVPARLIDRLVAEISPRYVPSDLVDFLLSGGPTPFQRVSDDPSSLIDEMIHDAQRAPVEWEFPSPRLQVGNVDRDTYVVGTVADPSVSAPVAVWSSNALFTIPVAPSLPALFLGFAECVLLWDASALAVSDDGDLALQAWWEALWPLPSSSAESVIPGAADALLRIYREENEEWPTELPTWEGLDGPEGWWAELFGVYKQT